MHEPRVSYDCTEGSHWMLVLANPGGKMLMINLKNRFNVSDLHSYAVLLINSYLAKERPEKFGPKWDSNPDLSDAGAVLYQLSYMYQANWEHTCPIL